MTEQAEQFDFGEAIKRVKNGKVVARAGWNGKNMAVFLKKGAIDINSYAKATEVDPDDVTSIDNVPIGLFEVGDHGITTRIPCFCMQGASGSITEGWLASQIDMCAEDWFEAELVPIDELQDDTDGSSGEEKSE